jgi:16S rRNA (uracil1498-N3)-methyltransferase
MKIHRFIGNFDTKATEFLLTDPEIVHQMVSVLKLDSGEKLIVSDGRGFETTCSIDSISKKEVSLKNCEWNENKNESDYAVVLCLALLKKDNFELAIQKAVEVGVTEIVPLMTERTVKQGFVRPRLEKIIKEAAEQSARGVLPHLEEPLSFSDALFRANRKGTVFFCDSGKENVVPSKIVTKGTSYVFIGPEGGWTDAERESAREIGATFVSLSPTTLRAETAATIATYLFTSYSQN